MKNLKLDDFCGYRFLSELKYSPDGKLAALVVSEANVEKNNYESDICVLGIGDKPVHLTAGGDAKAFIWDANNEIIFPAMRKKADRERVEKGEKLTVFYKISTSGGEAREYFRIDKTVTGIKKIDDGKYALICTCHPDDYDFSTMSEAEKIAAYKKIKAEKDYEVMDEIPFWGNGKGFTNKKRSVLFTYDVKEKKLTQVSDSISNVTDFDVKNGKLLFVLDTFTDKKSLTNSIKMFDIATGSYQTVLEDGECSVRAARFTDSRILVAATYSDKHGNNQNPHIYTADSGKLNLLCELDESPGTFTNSDCRYGSGKTFMVYGEELYYTVCTHVKNALRKITRDGVVETLVEMDDTFDGFDIGAEKGVIYYGVGALRLHEVFFLNNGTPHKITNINEKFMADKKLSEPIPLIANGEEETIEGFVMKPVDFDPAKKYPAILNIHGGPKTAFGSSFFHENQFWANKGYFVIFCNPWGSDGRGNRFADLRGRYGTIDYNDLMTFTDKCIETYPQIDDKKLAVTGGSYGGFMTNWIIGHTDRFCCAASQRSIANWIGKFGTTDIGYYFNADQMASTPWSDQEKMWWHSPMKYADKCVTPTLFIHSEEDYRCWLPEGIQMFTSLKYHGCEARLCMFRGENHELSRSGKPLHRIRRLEEITGWFEKYFNK